VLEALPGGLHGIGARLARQALLTRDGPPAAWFLVDEAALRRYVGSADVMAARLAHLAGRQRAGPGLQIVEALSAH